MAKGKPADEASTALGIRIREARRNAKPPLTQEALGAKVGVTKGAVSQWEKGDIKNLRNANLFRLADALGVEARWLATGTEPRVRQGRPSPEDEARVKEITRALADLSPAQRDLFIRSEEVQRVVTGPVYPVEKMGPDWSPPKAKRKG